MADLVEVLRTTRAADAQLKASLLKGRGIHVTVVSSGLAASIGAGTGLIPVRLLVPDNEAGEARDLLVALDVVAAHVPDGGPETCPVCRARWEPGFDVCWQCGCDLDDPAR